MAINLQYPLGGIGDQAFKAIKENVSTEKPLGGLGEKAMNLLFPYGTEGSVPQRERAVKTGLTSAGAPLPLDMQEKLRLAKPSPAVTKESIAKDAVAAVPIAAPDAATEAAPSTTWERGIGAMDTAKKGYETEFKFEDASGARINPADYGKIKGMEGVKLSARGIGSPEDIEKQKTINMLEKESYAEFPSAVKMQMLAEAKGLKGITPYEKQKLAGEEAAAKTQKEQFKSTHDLAVEKQMADAFSKVAGTESVKGQDALGNEITTTKVTPEMYQKVMEFGDGKITAEAIQKTVQWKRQKTAVAQGLPLLIANKGNQKMMDAVAKQMLDQGVPQSDIDAMIEQAKTAK